MMVEKWKTAELRFVSDYPYADPLFDVSLSVTFKSERGTIIERPAFWNGKCEFAVRAALTEEGSWEYTTFCSDTQNTGLHLRRGKLCCVPYKGDCEIYKRGFLTVRPNTRYFSYHDGTPFFYLGDTHWFLCHEKWDESNVEGIDSQFCYTVNHRVSQGFTVYQSEPLGIPNIPQIYDLTDGLDENDILGFQKLDEKFAYIAECGLVHANSQLFFTDEISNPAYTPEYLRLLARFWVARYGSYPVLWTVAQEIDPHCYGTVYPERWYTVAEAIAEFDAYRHPLTAHGANNCLLTSENSAWNDKPYHSWFGLQPQEYTLNNTSYLKGFYQIAKPIVCYETGYEELWADKAQALGAGYKAYLNGMCGYGYGAQGVWNDDYSPDDWMHYGDYRRWFDALQFDAGKKLIHCRHFFEALEWWKLEPHFDDPEWSSFKTNERKALASIANDTYVVFLFDETLSSGELRHLKNTQYQGLWYDIDSGVYNSVGTCEPSDGVFVIPQKPDKRDWIFLLTDNFKQHENRPLIITSADNATTIKSSRETLQLYTNFPAAKWWSSPEIVTIDNGLVKPMGINGVTTVYAEDSNGNIARKTVIMVRQDKTEPAPIPLKITVTGERGLRQLSKKQPKLQVMAHFDPPDCYDQQVHWEITEPDGSATNKAFMETTGSVTAISDGCVKVTAYSENYPKVFGSAIFEITEFGMPSLSIGARVTSSDYYEGYDKRCYPWRAVNGATDNYTGWCSAQLCSPDNPVYLIIDLQTEKTFCQIDLYTTSLACALRDYAVQIERGGTWVTVASMADNTERKNTFRFETPISARRLRVECTKGDINGNARIDQINLFPHFCE